MERVWLFVSVAGFVTAAILLIQEMPNAAFVVATIGAVAWFLNYRTKLRSTINESDETTEDEDDASESQDEE